MPPKIATHLKLGEHLYKAFDAQDLAAAEDLIKKAEGNIKMLNWKNPYNYMYGLVHLVAKNGNIDLMQMLIKEFVLDFEAMTLDNKRPVHVAALKGSIAVLECLLKRQVEVNVLTKDLFSPLHYACINGHEKAVRLLLKFGANIETLDKASNTPLLLAIKNDHFQTVKELIISGCQLNVVSKDGWFPLHESAIKKTHAITMLLTGVGVDAGMKVNKGTTAAMCAKSNNSYWQYDMSRRLGLAICKSNSSIPEACEAVEKLLTDMEVHGLALQDAIWNGNVEKVAIHLAACKQSVDFVHPRKSGTALHLAVQRKNAEITKMIIAAGGSLEAQSVDAQYTPLHFAALYGREVMIDILLAAGANKLALAINGDGVMHIAAKFGHHNIVAQLLGKQVPFDIPNKIMLQPFHYAAMFNKYSVLELLVSAGVDVKGIDAINGPFASARDMVSDKELYDLCVFNGTAMYKKELSPRTSEKLCANRLLDGQKIVNFIKNSKNNNSGVEITKKVSSIMSNNKSGCFFKSKFTKWTPLHWAAATSDRDEVIKCIIAAGPSSLIEAKDRNDWTPLHLACNKNEIITVNTLLEAKADANVVGGNEFETPLHLATKFGYLEIVTTLLKYSANVNSTNLDKVTPLHLAANRGFYELVNLLVENGANINAETKPKWCNWKMTPLHYAIKGNHLKVVEYLLKNGANIESQASNLSTPLHIAVKNGLGSRAMIKLLLQYKPSLNVQDAQGNSPLHIAARQKMLDTVTNLIELGADPDLKNKDGKCPRGLCHLKDDFFNAEQKGLDLKEQAAKRAELLFQKLKAEAGNELMEAVEKLDTPLARSIIERNPSCVHHIDPKTKETPLHYASKSGHADGIAMIIEAGAKVNPFDKYHFTPLASACRVGKIDSCRELMDRGGALDALTSDSFTPLHLAIKNGFNDVAIFLVNCGADVNHAENAEKLTPLHFAGQYGRIDIVKHLITKGADHTAVSRNRESASDLAHAKNFGTDFDEVLKSGLRALQRLSVVGGM